MVLKDMQRSGLTFENLVEIESPEDLDNTLADNEKLIICAGRNASFCRIAFQRIDKMTDKFSGIAFRVIDIDSFSAASLVDDPRTYQLRSFPYTFYCHNKEIVHVTDNLPTEELITQKIAEYFNGQ